MLPRAVPWPCLAGSTPAVLLVPNLAGHPSNAVLMHPAHLQDCSGLCKPPLPARQFCSLAFLASFLHDQAWRGHAVVPGAESWDSMMSSGSSASGWQGVYSPWPVAMETTKLRL